MCSVNFTGKSDSHWAKVIACDGYVEIPKLDVAGSTPVARSKISQARLSASR